MIGLGILVVMEIGLLAVLGWIWLGRRPTAPKFAAAHGLTIDDASLPLAHRTLRAGYRGRVLGAPVGGLALGLFAWGLGLAVAAPYLVLLGFVGGTMIGVVLAQRRRGPEPGPVREASLTARMVADYSPKHAAWSVAVAAVACAGSVTWAALSAPVGLGPYAGILVIAAAAVVVAPFGRRLQRRVVEAPRGDADPTVDDALRAATVRTVHHAVLAILCCGIVLAGLTGAFTHSTLAVVSNGEIVFRAPPGSTSISADTGLRQAGNPNAPIRVFWIEADGSEHDRTLLTVGGGLGTTTTGLDGFAILPGWLCLLVSIEALIQWARATSAWKRGGPGARHGSRRRGSTPEVVAPSSDVPESAT